MDTGTRHPTFEDRLVWVALGGILLLMVLVRTWVPYSQVFQHGDIVLAANDPYAFRYYLDRLLESGLHPFWPIDWARIPSEIAAHDVTFIVTMWMAAVLLGGSAYAGGLVLAAYPVVAAVATGIMVYLIAVWTTSDRRIGLVAVLLLALTPAHAYRTMLGFGDHDAFGYVALMLTVTGLVWLLRADARRQRFDLWYGVGVVLASGGMITASLGWRGGPILIAPIGIFAVSSAVLCVKHGRPPLRANRGMILSLALGTWLGFVVYFVGGWGEVHRALAPFLLLGLVLAVVVVGEGVHRVGVHWVVSAVPIPLVGLGWFAGLWMGVSIFAEPLERFWEFASGPDADVGERVSLFAGFDTTILMFGLLLLVAVPVMLWVLEIIWEDYRPNWLLLSSFAWGFLVLASFRYRWSALAALFVVVFGAVGVLYLAARMEVTQPVSFDVEEDPLVSMSIQPWHIREWGRAVVVVALVVVLILGMGMVQMPGTMTAITHDDTTHETATFIAGYAAEQDLEDPYVFTEWGSNRAYNYHVSGESRDYGYARNNYRPFVSSSEPSAWEDAVAHGDFVVVQDSQFAYPTDSMQVRLNDRYGSAGDGVEGLSHYRLVYVSEDTSTKVFQVVPGATISGTAEANTTVTIETDVTVGGEAFQYVRVVETDPDGAFTVTVPYAGTYTSDHGSVDVAEEEVIEGVEVRMEPNED